MAQPAKAREPGDATPVTITYNPDGTSTMSPNPVVIDNDTEINFNVSNYEPGCNQCVLTVSFSWQMVSATTGTTGNTIKLTT